MSQDARLATQLARCAQRVPYFYIADRLPPSRFRRYLQSYFEQKIRRAVGISLSRESPQRGFAFLEEAPWDSDVFGLRSFRLEFPCAEHPALLRSLVRKSERAARVRDGNHLCTRLRGDDRLFSQLLERAGYLTVDNLSTFVQEPDALLPGYSRPRAIAIDRCRETDLPAVLRIACTAFQNDRFHADPAIPARRLARAYSSWVLNAFDKRIGGDLYVARVNKKVQGFLFLQHDHEFRRQTGLGVSRIVLIATARDAYSRGIGTALVCHAARCARDDGSRLLLVGTQNQNIPAARLFIKSGFDLCGIEVTLSKSLE